MIIDFLNISLNFNLNRWDDRDTLVSIFQKTTKSNDIELLKKHTLKLQILTGGFREVKIHFSSYMSIIICIF
jgi:hypothetical protein